MEKIIFTLCSNNYLAHAKTLGDSLLKHAPGVRFVIGLVDQKDPAIDYSASIPYEILCYDELGFSCFAEMLGQYNVIEFNTAVKPFYIEYFFKKTGENSLVYYIDPDIAFYSGMKELDQLLSVHNCLLTPHLIEPHLNVSPYETMILNVGIYNLGFLGIRNTEESRALLSWWQERMKNHGYIDHARGLFVDQIWMNLVPILFREVHIIMSPVYNMACWNFHERKIMQFENKVYVNDTSAALCFFHFSGFRPKDFKYLGKIKTFEFTLEARPDLENIFREYSTQLINNQYEFFSSLRPKLNFAYKRYSRKQRIGLALKFKTNSYIKKMFQV